jgi:hypothetical protein
MVLCISWFFSVWFASKYMLINFWRLNITKSIWTRKLSLITCLQRHRIRQLPFAVSLNWQVCICVEKMYLHLLKFRTSMMGLARCIVGICNFNSFLLVSVILWFCINCISYVSSNKTQGWLHKVKQIEEETRRTFHTSATESQEPRSEPEGSLWREMLPLETSGQETTHY